MSTFLLVALLFHATTQSPQITTIAGTVTLADGSASAGLVVVVFPEDPTERAGAESAVRVRRVTVANGAFAIGGLPAGRYRLAIADQAELGDWASLELLDRLAASSVPTPPIPSGRLTLELTVSSEPGIRRVTEARGTGSGVVMRRSGPGRRGRQPVMPPPPPPAGTSQIAGRVLVDGGPARGVRVAAVRWLTGGPVRRLATVRGTQLTDSDGRFAVTGLRAGEYFVAAFADGTGREAMLGDATVSLPPVIVEEDGTRSAVTTTFHPGVNTPAQARMFRIGDGQAVAGVEFAMRRAPSGPVSGRFVNAAGEAIRGIRALLRPAAPEDQIGGANVRAAPLAADGSFQFDDVPHGEYDLLLLGAVDLVGEHRIHVGEETVTGLEITPDPPILISGRVEFGGPAPAPGSFAGVTVALAPAILLTGARHIQAPVRPDGTFELRGIRGTQYRLEGEGPLPWQQVQGQIGPFDTLDMPFRLVQDRTDAVVVLASSDTSIAGTVVDESGRPLTNGTLIVFPAQRTRRHPDSRYMRIVPLAGDGLYSVSLPPGDYYAAAIGSLGRDGTIDSADLSALETEATRFTLDVGERKRLVITTRRR